MATKFTLHSKSADVLPQGIAISYYIEILEYTFMISNLAINGFGRIGRCFVKRSLADKEFQELAKIVAD